MDPGCEYADTVIASEAQLQPSWTPEETLGIVDKMMALELILYRGYHAGHTVASCHYLGGVELESITDPFLNLMVRATLITMEELHQIVRASEIGFEEEMIRIPPDFFKAELDAAKVLQELGTMLSALTAESEAGNVDAGLRAMRVQLRKDLLRLVVKAGERSGQNHPAKLKTDIAALTLAVEAVENGFCPDQCPAVVIQEHLERRDLGALQTARAIPALVGSEMGAELRGILDDLTAAYAGCPDGGATTTLEDVLAHLTRFGARRPCLFSRSVMRRWVSMEDRLLGSKGSLAVTETFCLQLKMPRHYLTHKRSEERNLMGAHRILIQSMFVFACLNPGRCMRRLRSMMREGPPMIAVCHELDAAISTEQEKRKFFNFYLVFQTIINSHMTLQFLRQGAMLGLYEPDEIEWVCWYMWNVHRQMDDWKEKLDQVTVKDPAKKSAKKGGGKKKGGGGGGGGNSGNNKSSVKVKVLTHHDLARAAEAQVCRGVYLSLLGLAMKGLWKAPRYPKDLQSTAARWKMRFTPVALPNSLPKAIDHETFQKTRVEDVRNAKGGDGLLEQAVACYQLAVKKVSGAQRSADSSEAEVIWLRKISSVAEGSLAQLEQLSTQAANGSGKASAKVSFDWTVCPHLPLIKIDFEMK